MCTCFSLDGSYIYTFYINYSICVWLMKYLVGTCLSSEALGASMLWLTGIVSITSGCGIFTCLAVNKSRVYIIICMCVLLYIRGTNN